MPRAAALTTRAQNRVDCTSAPRGPPLSSTKLYPMSMTREKGLTKALANGKAAVLVYPVDDEVKSDTVIDRAKE